MSKANEKEKKPSGKGGFFIIQANISP